MRKPTQADIVLKILREEGSITNFFCIENKISLRLAAIIHDLKTKGLIELDEEKCGAIEDTKNYRYVVKPIKPKSVEVFTIRGGNDDGTDKVITKENW